VPRMSVYDYWSIPDWSHDLPTFDYLEKGPRKLRSWHERHVDGFNAESTYSGGAMGPAWYLLGKLAWDPKLDERKVLAEFYEQAFGPARAPMQRMLERWTMDFHLSSHELGLSFRDLDEAWKISTQDPACQARVGDTIRYVEYLRLYFEYRETKRGSPPHQEATLALLRHGWNIYDSAMIHAFRLSQLVVRDELKAGEDLRKRYDSKNPQAPGWREIVPLADGDLPGLVAGGLERYRPQDFEPRRFSGKWMPLSTSLAPRLQTFSPVMIPASGLELLTPVAANLKSLTLKIGCEKAIRVRVTGAGKRIVFNEMLETGPAWRETWTEVKIPLAEPGLYRIQLWSPGRPFRLPVPAGVPLVMPEFKNSQGLPTPKLYFFVPEGLKRLALVTTYSAAGPPRFFDPQGAEVKPQLVDGGKMLLIDIPARQAGQVWSLSHAKVPNQPLRFLNAPQAYAFFPETLLIPEDAFRAP
jgi:hypothetical protein